VAIRRRAIAIAAAIFGLGIANPATTAFGADSTPAVNPSPTTQPAESTDAQLRELRAQVQQLVANQKVLEQQLAQATTRPVPIDLAIVQAAEAQTAAAVRADADRRSQLFDMTGETAGYDRDRGFYVSSGDGEFLIHPFVLLQVRNVTESRVGAKSDGTNDTQNGFEIRRFQLGADGNVFTPDLTCRFFVQSSRETGEVTLFDAWVRYRLDHGPWSIEAGQFKAPLDHEQLISDKTQLAADRTYTDDILAKGEAFSEGVMALYDDNGGPLHAKVDFTNGYGVNDVNYEDFPARTANFGLGGRAEYKVFGKWRDYDQFTASEAKEALLVFGAGLDWTESGGSDAIRHVVDAQWDVDHVSLYGAYLGMYTTNNPAEPALPDTYDASFRAQFAYAIPDSKIEPFLRYDYLHLDAGEFGSGTRTTVHEITGGANYYFYGQNARFTLDVSYLPNGAPENDSGNGILANNGKAEWVERGQLQFAL